MAGTITGLAAARRRRLPFGVALAFAWVAGMLTIAVFADAIRPYSITALHLAARLTPPVGLVAAWRSRWVPTNWAATCCRAWWFPFASAC